MQPIEQTGSRGPATQRWQLTALVLALVALILSGIQALPLYTSVGLLTPFPLDTLPEASKPGVAPTGEAATETALSPRAIAQYQAFYEEQTANEAALERWALLEAPTPKVSVEHDAFIAQQMASEAALEQWSRAQHATTRVDVPPTMPMQVEGERLR